VEQGRIVEFAPPAVLMADQSSRYARLLAAEEEVRRGLWKGAGWRRLWMENGDLIEREPAPESEAHAAALERKA